MTAGIPALDPIFSLEAMRESGFWMAAIRDSSLMSVARVLPRSVSTERGFTEAARERESNTCELTVRDEHLIFQQKNFCGQKLSDLEILLHEILSLILFSLLGCQCML